MSLEVFSTDSSIDITPRNPLVSCFLACGHFTHWLGPFLEEPCLPTPNHAVPFWTLVTTTVPNCLEEVLKQAILRWGRDKDRGSVLWSNAPVMPRQNSSRRTAHIFHFKWRFSVHLIFCCFDFYAQGHFQNRMVSKNFSCKNIIPLSGLSVTFFRRDTIYLKPHFANVINIIYKFLLSCDNVKADACYPQCSTRCAAPCWWHCSVLVCQQLLQNCRPFSSSTW